MLSCQQHALHQGAGQIMGTCLGSKRIRPQRQRPGKRLQLQTVAVGWDPEGILRAPQGHHIQRRTMQKQVQDDEELRKKLEKEEQELRAKLDETRAQRRQPTSQSELLEYFLSTEMEEMQYEVARCRPQIDAAFMQYLDTEIGAERFSSKPREGRLQEIEALREFLIATVKLLDDRTAQITAPKERLMALLTSKDKKAAIMELAERNEIDEPLLNLLQQNIDAARSADQLEPAQFMEKIRDAARKFIITK